MLPPAQVAEQQGRYLAKELNEQARARSPAVPSVAFRYHHLGSMASLGAPAYPSVYV
jgi:NADH dehydrogenase FAD-containing subunit